MCSNKKTKAPQTPLSLGTLSEQPPPESLLNFNLGFA
jgi:hypothetical protein